MKSTLTFLSLLLFYIGSAQSNPTKNLMEGENLSTPPQPCLSAQQYDNLFNEIRTNIAELKKKGVIPEPQTNKQIALGWPLRQAPGLNYNTAYGITYFVDHNTNIGAVQDYNCGNRTYDGHPGTDIPPYPFPWNMVNNDLLEVVAAADGIIVAHVDGNPHTNCGFTDPNWNHVALYHTSDGSVTIYGHMKNGSLLAKPLNATVVAGEYLGIVASSGYSSAPHLHFEVRADAAGANTVVDPFVGGCNNTTATSWWTTQKPYYESRINTLMTHSTHPTLNNPCPNPNEMNTKDCFLPGERVYLYAYFHDERIGQVATHEIFRPDNSLYGSWTTSSPTQPIWASVWNNDFVLSATPPLGFWRYQVTFQGETVSHNFEVSTSCGSLPIELAYFKGEAEGNVNVLDWMTATEENNDFIVIERSINNESFIEIGRVAGQGSTTDPTAYSFIDESPVFGTDYYRLKQVDYDESFSYSPVIAIKNELSRDYEIFPSLATQTVHVKHSRRANIHKICVFNATGKLLQQVDDINNELEQIDVDLSLMTKGLLIISIYDEKGRIFSKRIVKG